VACGESLEDTVHAGHFHDLDRGIATRAEKERHHPGNAVMDLWRQLERERPKWKMRFIGCVGSITTRRGLLRLPQYGTFALIGASLAMAVDDAQLQGPKNRPRQQIPLGGSGSRGTGAA